MDSTPDLIRGGVVALRLLDRERWIHRRVDSVSFIDEQTVQRSVRVDLGQPDRTTWKFESVGLIPIALLQKKLLVNFDCRDEADARLPVLTTDEDNFLAWSALASVGKAIGDRAGLGPLSPDSLDILKRIATGDPDSAAAARLKLDLQREREPLVALLLDTPIFVQLCVELATNFMLIIDLGQRPSRRRVITFSYLEEVENPPTGSVVLAVLGLSPLLLSFEVPAVGEAGSFHFECNVPDDLDIEEADLIVEDPTDIKVGWAEIRGSYAHLFRRQTVSPGVTGEVFVFIKRREAGLLRVALLSSILIAAALSFYGLHLDEIRQEGPATSILLAVPGLLAALATRPGEHRLATRLFFGARVELAAAALLAYSGALLLTVRVDPVILNALWAALCAAAWGCTVLLSLGTFGLDWLPRLFRLESTTTRQT